MNIVPQLIQTTPEITAALVDCDAVEAWYLAVQTVDATADQIAEVVDRADVGIDLDADSADTDRLEWVLSSVAARHPACPQSVVAHALACQLADPESEGRNVPGFPPEANLFTTVLSAPNVTGYQLVRVCDGLMARRAERAADDDDGGGGLLGSWVDAWRNRRKKVQQASDGARANVAAQLVAHPNAPADLLETVVVGLVDGTVGPWDVGAQALASHPNLTVDLAELLVTSDHNTLAAAGASASVLGPTRAVELVVAGGPHGWGAAQNPSLPAEVMSDLAGRLRNDPSGFGVGLLANPSASEDVLYEVCDTVAPEGCTPRLSRMVRLRLERNPAAPVGLLRRYNAFAAAAAHPDADADTLRWAFDSASSVEVDGHVDDVVRAAVHHPEADAELLARLAVHKADRFGVGSVGAPGYAALLHRNADESVSAAVAEQHLTRRDWQTPLDMRIVQIVHRFTGLGADLLAWDALAGDG